jgi:hypothetical protein
MPTKKKSSGGGIPKSILADLNRVKQRIAALEKNVSNMGKEFKTNTKNFGESLKKHQSSLQSSIASLGKMKSAKKAKRKPSPYNLFLKEKMSSGMSMVDAVKAWKAREGGSSSSMSSTSSSSSTGDDWQSSNTQEES